MKSKKIFISVDADNVSGMFAYPQNIPLPRIGDSIIYDANRGRIFGKVYDVRHVITETTADIVIKVKEDK